MRSGWPFNQARVRSGELAFGGLTPRRLTRRYRIGYEPDQQVRDNPISAFVEMQIIGGCPIGIRSATVSPESGHGIDHAKSYAFRDLADPMHWLVKGRLLEISKHRQEHERGPFVRTGFGELKEVAQLPF